MIVKTCLTLTQSELGKFCCVKTILFVSKFWHTGWVLFGNSYSGLRFFCFVFVLNVVFSNILSRYCLDLSCNFFFSRYIFFTCFLTRLSRSVGYSATKPIGNQLGIRTLDLVFRKPELLNPGKLVFVSRDVSGWTLRGLDTLSKPLTIVTAHSFADTMPWWKERARLGYRPSVGQLVARSSCLSSTQ